MTGWHITDHVCRACLGRVLVDIGAATVRCADCGLAATDSSPASICACGARLPGKGKRPARDIGVRCTPNPARSAAVPAEIVAAEC